MSESLAILILAGLGILAMTVVAILAIKIMINTAKGSKSKDNE